jgi:hypothetical protein
LIVSPEGRILQARVVDPDATNKAVTIILEELAAIRLPKTGHDANLRMRVTVEFPAGLRDDEWMHVPVTISESGETGVSEDGG